jgi:hypothetical protein
MIRIALLALLGAVGASLGPCGVSGDAEEVLLLEIAAHTVECVGVEPRRCLLVRRDGQGAWTMFYDAIEGFTHEEGYRYRVEVARRRVPDPPADGSSYAYRLLRVLTREPAESQYVPGASGL